MRTQTLLLILMTILGMLLAMGLQGCLFGSNDEDGEVAEVDFEGMDGEPQPEMGMGVPFDDDMMDDGMGMEPGMAADGDASNLVSEGMRAKHEGNYSLARQHFESAIAADPSNVDAHWGAAWVYAETGSIDQAISAFETVLQLGASPDREREAQAALQRLQ